MAEWSNAAVLKTVVRLSVDRGFESLFLRQSQRKPFAKRRKVFLFYWDTWESLLSKGGESKTKNKTRLKRVFSLALKLPREGSPTNRHWRWGGNPWTGGSPTLQSGSFAKIPHCGIFLRSALSFSAIILKPRCKWIRYSGIFILHIWLHTVWFLIPHC